MRVLTDFNFQLNDTAVCIGKFDGIHRGHRLLIEKARRTGLEVVMLAFSFPGSENLYAPEEKTELAGRLGVDVLVMVPVDEEFMRMTAEEFIRKILVGCCGAKQVIVGEDFRFGHKRAGDVDYLQKAGADCGFQTCVVEKLRLMDDVVSSTRVRRLLGEGDMESVNALLGTPYFISGTVEEGNRIGRKMDAPTANIRPAESKVLPPFGVYAVCVEAGGEIYRGIGNLGVKPTVSDGNPVGLEVWLFDFQGNLYGKKLTVFLIRFQREEKKFSSIEALRRQIALDKEEAERSLAKVSDLSLLLY